MRINVVLPQPEGPTSDTNSPWPTSKLTWVKASMGSPALVA